MKGLFYNLKIRKILQNEKSNLIRYQEFAILIFVIFSVLQMIFAILKMICAF